MSEIGLVLAKVQRLILKDRDQVGEPIHPFLAKNAMDIFQHYADHAYTDHQWGCSGVRSHKQPIKAFLGFQPVIDGRSMRPRSGPPWD